MNDYDMMEEMLNAAKEPYEERKRECKHFDYYGTGIYGLMSGHHAQMKVRLTTAEWQRDSLELRLDSIKVMDGGNVTYYRYRPYKEK